MLNTYSVKFIYPLLLLTLVLAVALLLGGLAVTGTKQATDDLLLKLTDQTTERMRLAVLDNLESPKRLAAMNARLIETGRLEAQDVKSFIPEFMAQMSSFEGIGSILISNGSLDTMWIEWASPGQAKVALYLTEEDTGLCTEWNIDESGNIVGQPLGSYSYYPPDRPWYKTVVSVESENSWVPLYAWASTSDDHQIGTEAVEVLKDSEGEIEAIIGVGFSVKELSEYLSGIELTPNARIFVTNAAGMLVASGSPDVPVSKDGELIKAVSSDSALVSSVSQRLDTPDFIDDDGYAHSMVVGPGGENQYVVSESLGRDDMPDWTLVMIVPESDLLSGVTAVRTKMILFGLIVVLIAGIAGLFLAKSIARPIVSFRQSAGEVSAGDLDATFHGQGGLEFMQLAQDLDSMRNDLKDRLEIRNSLAVAMEVQQNLLPANVPDNPNLDIAAFSTYCDETGGDYYDFPDFGAVEEADDGSLLLAIGDVTGHGIAAALIMATARASIRTRLRHEGSLGMILCDVNEVLEADIPGGRFMTLLALVISPDGSSFKWAGAGHDPPLIYDSVADNFREPEGGDVPLGIIPDATFDEHHSEFGPPGSILLVGTDGIWETAAPNGDMFGKDRLRELMHTHRLKTSQQIGAEIISALDAFRGSDRPLDDVTLVVIKRRDSNA